MDLKSLKAFFNDEICKGRTCSKYAANNLNRERKREKKKKKKVVLSGLELGSKTCSTAP